MKSELTVVIATHNRPYLLLETIESVLNQEYKNFYFVVSDNSDNNDTFNVLEEKSLLKNFEYRKRNNVAGLDHFNIILNEIKTKYFILFHDDDIMLPEMVGKLFKAISSDEYLAAAGCNGYIYEGNKKLRKTMLHSRQNILLPDQKSIILRYCNNHNNIVPFPSYIYNAHIIKSNNIFISDYAGKYSDVIWLLDIVKFGKIFWLNEPLMLYRVHKGQDSTQFSYKDQYKLELYYLKILPNEKENRMFKKYRIHKIYLAMCRRLKQKKRLSLFIIRQLLLLLYYSPYKYFIKYCIKYIITKKNYIYG